MEKSSNLKFRCFKTFMADYVLNNFTQPFPTPLKPSRSVKLHGFFLSAANCGSPCRTFGALFILPVCHRFENVTTITEITVGGESQCCSCDSWCLMWGGGGPSNHIPAENPKSKLPCETSFYMITMTAADLIPRRFRPV